MLGSTGLNSLRIDCVVGVCARERAQTQPISIDIEFDVAAAAANANSFVRLERSRV